MSKIRVHELAKELNISSKELTTLLMDEFNVEVKNHMSTIEERGCFNKRTASWKFRSKG